MMRQSEPRVIVYTKPSCVQCTATYRMLVDAGLTFDVVDLSTDPDALELVKELGYLQAPIVVTGDDHWSGFRPDKIAELLSRPLAPTGATAPGALPAVGGVP